MFDTVRAPAKLAAPVDQLAGWDLSVVFDGDLDLASFVT